MKTIFVLLGILLSTGASLACPEFGGQYGKVPGSDSYSDNMEDPGSFVQFPLRSFSFSARDCRAALISGSGRVYDLVFDPEERAFVATWDLAFYRFLLRVKPEGEELRTTYSRTRTFLRDYAPVFSHSARFERMK